MAINPGTDLLSEALLAAEPQRAKAAEERLVRLGGEQNAATGADFDALLSPSKAIRMRRVGLFKTCWWHGSQRTVFNQAGEPVRAVRGNHSQDHV